MKPCYDKTQANQAPEGAVQSGVFAAQGHGSFTSNPPRR